MSSFVVVANRLPVDEVITESGRTWRRSPGGLVTALHPVLVEHEGAWIGWSGGMPTRGRHRRDRGRTRWSGDQPSPTVRG